MKIVGKKVLHDFKEKHADVRSQIDAWEAEAEAATWNNSLDIKKRYASASFLQNRHIVFNLKGNRYRLLVQVSYNSQIVQIKKVGTHDEYLKW